MPTPFYHLSVAESLLEYSGNKTRIPDLIDRYLPSFLLGHVSPDVQVISGQSRESTHFYTLPTKADDKPPWLRLLDEFSNLKSSELRNPEQAVFLAGYLCHLQADWFWVREIFEPYFGPNAEWKTFRDRLYLHNVLRSYLDHHVLKSLKLEIRTSLAQSKPKNWLPFVNKRDLIAWCEFLTRQLKPGAIIKTVEVFASRQGISAENYYRLLQTEEEMQFQVFDYVPRERLLIFGETLLIEGVRLVEQYLDNFEGA